MINKKKYQINYLDTTILGINLKPNISPTLSVVVVNPLVGFKPLRQFLLIIFFVIGIEYTASAEVFSLTPFSGKSGGDSLFRITEGIDLFDEPVVINGEDSTLKLKLLRNDLIENTLLITKQFPKALLKSSPGALLVEFKNKNGTLERIYLVQVDGPFPVIQFSMQFPNGLPRSNGDWLKELPKTVDATVLTTMSLPDRKISYGTFTTPLTPERAISDIDAEMKSNGWTTIDRGIYIKDSPLSIVLSSFTVDDNDITRGFILKRPLKK